MILVGNRKSEIRISDLRPSHDRIAYCPFDSLWAAAASMSVSAGQLAVGEVGRCPECGCVGPNPGYLPLPPEEVERELVALPTWRLAPYPGDRVCLSLRMELPDRWAVLRLVNAISAVAESPEIAHHPDLLLQGSVLEVRLTTHAAGGLTAYDLRLAHALEDVFDDALR